MKGFFKNFTKTVKDEAIKDYEYFNGEGAVAKALKFYKELKLLLIRSWNKFINKLVNLQLLKLEKEMEKYYKTCKDYGENPEDHYGERLKKRIYS